MTVLPQGPIQIAVIGLGSMGSGIARSLRRAGHHVAVYDANPRAAETFAAEGWAVCSSPAEAASGAEAVVSVVVNGGQTEAVLYGSGGCAEAMKPDGVFVCCTTLNPDEARDYADRLERIGRHYLDAPVSGGARRAAEGTLTIMASGTAPAFFRAKPVLAATAAKVFELGDCAGAGSAFKIVNQLLAGVHIVAASEAMAFAAAQGLSLRKVYEVITQSAGNSWMFEDRMRHVLDDDYSPRSMVDIFVKDLGIVTDIARDAKAPVPIAAQALQMFLMTSARGMGRDDDSSVARLYAELSGKSLRSGLKGEAGTIESAAPLNPPVAGSGA